MPEQEPEARNEPWWSSPCVSAAHLNPWT